MECCELFTGPSRSSKDTVTHQRNRKRPCRLYLSPHILGEPRNNKINKLIRAQLLSNVPRVLTYPQCKRTDRLQRPLMQYQSEERAAN